MDSRRNRLAAQKAQVALVFQKMLGKEEARAYLIENNFAESTIDRILDGDATRKRAAPCETEEACPRAARHQRRLIRHRTLVHPPMGRISRPVGSSSSTDS